MAFSTLGTQARQIFCGHLLVALCCLFYLAWWVVAFKPGAASRPGLNGVLLGLAIAAGLAGVILTMLGIRAMAHDRVLFPDGAVLIGGAVVYVVLLLITSFVFKRQVTTELFLIVGWVVLELSAVNVLYGSGTYGLTGAVAASVIVVVSAVLSFVCYMLYYNLETMPGYIDGMIPLGLTAAVMLGLGISLVV